MNGNPQPPMLPEPKKSIWLWVILGAAVLVVLVLAFYLYYAPAGQEDCLGPVSSSAIEEKAVADLEKDLQAESLEGLDAELNDIDLELAQ